MIIRVNILDKKNLIIIIYFLGQINSTIAEEKLYNTRLTNSREEFVNFMKELKLSYPQQIGKIIFKTKSWIIFIHLF